jgi:hypothetical protein
VAQESCYTACFLHCPACLFPLVRLTTPILSFAINTNAIRQTAQTNNSAISHCTRRFEFLIPKRTASEHYNREEYSSARDEQESLKMDSEDGELFIKVS